MTRLVRAFLITCSLGTICVPTFADEVVVTAASTALPSFEVARASTVIDAQELERRSVPLLGEALRGCRDFACSSSARGAARRELSVAPSRKCRSVFR